MEPSNISCYTLFSKGRIYAYTDSSLSTRTGGYIDCPTDECRITACTSQAVQVSYPTSSGRRTAWFSRESFTPVDLTRGVTTAVASAKFTTYTRYNSSNIYGSVYAGDTVYLPGVTSNGKTQLIYPVSGGYKMAWANASDVQQYLSGSGSETGSGSNSSSSGVSYSGSSAYQSGPYYTALTSLRLIGNPRADIVAIAQSQVGYCEGSNSSQLDGTTKGSGNYTEYGKWYGLQDMWCSMFVGWCAAQAGVSTSVIYKTASTNEGVNQFISQGCAHTRQEVQNGSYTPQPGDIIYFRTARNNSKVNHVGIVTSYQGGTVHTIEGNSNNKVETRTYSISDSQIIYICSPNY